MFLKVKEAAELLRLSGRQVYTLVKKNVIPHSRLGGTILVHKKELLKQLGVDKQ